MLIAYDPAQNPLNGSELIFPILECIHIIGSVLLVGTIATVDFRLLGFGLKGAKAAEITRTLSPWTLVGLALMLISGPLMFSSDPDMYYLNHAFQAKMVLFALALLFHYTIRRRIVFGNASSGSAKAAAGVSLALWASVIFGAIFIAFV
jgi:uncharacterized protein DUF6644